MRIRTDADAIQDDVVELLNAGRFADALVPAALQAERAGADPRALTFLAELVRRGGAAFAAGQADPMPDQNQTHLVRPWLLAPTASPTPPVLADAPGPLAAGDAAVDARIARWLDGVAMLIEARRRLVAFS
ncbi:hypothetical protein [Actinoplanes subglobosus]|uniref:Uncharacterized protein n=1 Tax=Actinoplanes subglobosus TaxID=1547892 RepID=A0ABV8J3G0_9ACTN